MISASFLNVGISKLLKLVCGNYWDFWIINQRFITKKYTLDQDGDINPKLRGVMFLNYKLQSTRWGIDAELEKK